MISATRLDVRRASRPGALLLLLAVGCAPAGDNSSPQGGSGGAGGAQGGRGGSTGGSGGASNSGGSGGGGASGSGGSGGTGGAGGSGGTGGASGGAGGGGAGGSGGASGSGGSGGASGSGGAGGSATTDAGPKDTGGPSADGPGIPGPLTGKGLLVAAGFEGGSTLTSFNFDFASGAITRLGAGTPGGGSPDYVAFHPSGKFLFVNNELGGGRATAMSVGADGALTRLNDTSSGGGSPCHIWVHKTGKWLLSANYTDGRVAVLPIGDDGRLGAAASTQNAGGNAHMALDDGASGNFVFVVAAAAGHVAQYRFNAGTGQLTPNTPATAAISQRPRHMAFNPNARWAYVTHESRAALTTFNYDSNTGLLSGQRDTPAPNDGAHVLAHPSGNFVYHIARGGSAITSFAVEPDGLLRSIGAVGGGNPYDATMTSDGRYLIAVGGTGVRVFSIDASGKLTMVGAGQTLQRSQSVAVTAL